LPSNNLDTNPKELYAPKSTPKKLGDGGDKKKIDLDMVLCENKAWQKVNIVFQELSK
jgi:hypothetical protein